MTQATSQTLSFQAETRQLMDLMVHSLYSHREIFLRELISNASDALDKLRFESLSAPELVDDGAELQITVELDKDARTLTIRDNGIGMSEQEIVDNIGTIAKSGTRDLIEQLSKTKSQDRPEELIGQFGVGFYSAFMVADKVTLVTRRAGQENATQWESDGKGEYTLTGASREHQGTTITLHLRDASDEQDLDDFVEEAVIRRTVKKYSDFIRYPIVLRGDPINSMTAIWRKRKQDVTQDEYNEFYKHISLDWEPPLKTITLKAEGRLEYHALLYVPTRAPMDLFHHSQQWGPTLYVKNVRIMEHCEDLVPRYLRFVRGVVDSSDLPLNVSREMLQHHGQIRVLRNGVTKKILDALRELQEKHEDQYTTFWDQFGAVLKEGVAALGEGNQDKLAPLFLFYSSHDDNKRTTLSQYVDRMSDKQDAIYYLTGTSRDVVANSPLLEAFKKRQIEVLYLVDPIDEFVVQSLTEFAGKTLKSAAKGELTIEDEGESQQVEKDLEDKAKEFSGVLLKIQKKLDKHIKEARLSSRLTNSAVCLVGGENDMSPQLSRLLSQGKQDVPVQRRIMEINPDHAICRHMKGLYRENSSDTTLDDYADLLLGLGLLAEGTLPPDPSQFTRLVADLMVRSSLAG